MWIALAALLGALVGWLVMRNLRTLGYRRSDELVFPRPTHVRWTIPALAVAWALLTWRHADQPWPVLVLWLPLTAALTWLSAVDLDVQRLPNKALGPSAAWVTAIIGLYTVTTGRWLDALITLSIGAAVGASAWALHWLSHGALGFGDVKLAAVLCAALALTQPGLVLPALLGSCLLALAAALIARSREVSFGPWLALGITVAACGILSRAPARIEDLVHHLRRSGLRNEYMPYPSTAWRRSASQAIDSTR